MTAPIIVTAEMGAEDQHWANALRERHFPPERNHLAAHITLFHHLPPGCHDELLALLAVLSKAERPAAHLDRMLLLGRGVAFHIESDALLAIRSEMAERFTGLLTPQDMARPRFHITVQNKVAPDVARETMRHLEQEFSPRPLIIAGLAAWWYRGGPWELIRRYPFRG